MVYKNSYADLLKINLVSKNVFFLFLKHFQQNLVSKKYINIFNVPVLIIIFVLMEYNNSYSDLLKRN